MRSKILVLLLIVAIGCQPKPEVRLNQMRVIGSHNSYKIAIEPAIWQMLYLRDSVQAISLQYEHISLTNQLDLGLRNLEIDVFHDPVGGRFASPKGRKMAQSAGVDSPAFDDKGDLEKPGLKVFHIQDVDFRSHHLLFIDALKALKRWSEQNHDHVPVIITVNTKDQVIPDLTVPLLFTKAALDSVDLEIRNVFAEEDLVTPDFVRGSFSTLEVAILTQGWPALDDCKGKFLFVLDEKGQKRADYLEDHPSCEGRVMFANVEEENPAAAFMIINDPITNQEVIMQMVQKGYMVRTRADAATKEARNEDYTKFQAALSSGAQVITTDYYLPSKLFPSSYRIVFEDTSYVIIP